MWFRELQTRQDSKSICRTFTPDLPQHSQYGNMRLESPPLWCQAARGSRLYYGEGGIQSPNQIILPLRNKNFKAGGGAASTDTPRAQVKTSLRMGVQQKALTTRERAGNNLGPRILYQCPQRSPTTEAGSGNSSKRNQKKTQGLLWHRGPRSPRCLTPDAHTQGHPKTGAGQDNRDAADSTTSCQALMTQPPSTTGRGSGASRFHRGTGTQRKTKTESTGKPRNTSPYFKLLA